MNLRKFWHLKLQSTMRDLETLAFTSWMMIDVLLLYLQDDGLPRITNENDTISCIIHSSQSFIIHQRSQKQKELVEVLYPEPETLNAPTCCCCCCCRVNILVFVLPEGESLRAVVSVPDFFVIDNSNGGSNCSRHGGIE